MKIYQKCDGNDHTFVVCGYRESPYLDECICSLLNQTVKSNVIITTATPNTFISVIAKKYGVSICVNDNQPEISSDWNFGYQCANTPLVTLAHQDDIYEKEYLEEVLKEINTSGKTLIAFGNYGEIRDGIKSCDSKLLKIKRMMLFPLRFKVFRQCKFIRRRILSLGNPICCPSVTYVKSNLPKVLFQQHFKSNVDWEAWERISKMKGSFVYCKKNLMYHRIHEESTTTEIINDNVRKLEDIEIFKKFWPVWVAKLIEKIYVKSEKSNQK